MTSFLEEYELKDIIKKLEDDGHKVKSVSFDGANCTIKVRLPIKKNTPKEEVENIRNKKLRSVSELFPNFDIFFTKTYFTKTDSKCKP